VIDLLPHYGKFKPETVKIGNVSIKFLPLLAGSNFIPATVKIGLCSTTIPQNGNSHSSE
jgi:hypothetical protein